MFKPSRSLAFRLAWRYTRARRAQRFISFIALTSMIGIALGVMVLIVVLSVFNGFDEKIREHIFSFVPAITISGEDGRLSNWTTLLSKVEKMPGVTGAAPVVNGQALLTINGESHPAMVVGILPAQMDHVIPLSAQVTQGHLSALTPGHFKMILGEGFSGNLGVIQGDQITLMVPTATVTPLGVVPRFKQFQVAGFFHSGSGFGFDTSYVFIHLADAQVLYLLGNQVSGIELRVQDPFTAPLIAATLSAQLGPEYGVSDWTDQFGAFYHAVVMEKQMMFLILLLLIAIAAFNLVSGLVMMVNEKRADIAILRTLGATPTVIRHVFLWQGAMIGGFGVLIGVVLGVLFALNISSINVFLEHVFHVQLFTPGVYFVDELPSKIELRDVIKVGAISFLLSMLATVYPAWRAARIAPAEALRYE